MSLAERFVSVEHVNFSYPDGTKALSDVSIGFDQGESVALIGQNGSGKTTLAKILKGLLKPSGGKVYIGGADAAGQTVAQLARQVGYVFQNPSHQIFSMTIFDEVAFGLRNLAVREDEIKERVAAALLEVGLHHREAENPLFLSKGEKQRLAVASVMVMNPKVLILDEPTTGQDWRNIETMMKLVRSLREKYNQTSILITHNMHVVAEWAQRSVVMSNAEIIYDGDTRSLFSEPKVLSSAFIVPTPAIRLGQDLHMSDHPLTVGEFVREFMLERQDPNGLMDATRRGAGNGQDAA